MARYRRQRGRARPRARGNNRRRPAQRRRYGARRRAPARRRRGAGILAELKYVSNIPGRLVSAPWVNDAATITGNTTIQWLKIAAEPLNGSEIMASTAFKDAGTVQLSRFANTSNGQLLTHCGQGFEAHRRIGLQINPRSFLIRMTLTAACLMTPSANALLDSEVYRSNASGQPYNGTQSGAFIRTTIRIVVYRDNEPVQGGGGGAVNESRTWKDLFNSQGVPSVNDFLNINNTGKYSVVVDQNVSLDNDSPQRDIQIRVPIANALRYGGPFPNDVRAGHYYVMCCCESVIGPESTAVNNENYLPSAIYYQHRMSYTDS